jgi:DNA-binding transcriptional MerR regulator
MINNIKTIFSIKDLENLSGIKAHTIRIWEKRYAILEPMRTKTNIRLYNLESLQKLLNVNFLHQYGYKISKIALYSEDEIPKLVKEIISNKNAKNHAINFFKIAMLNFDQGLFISTYNWLIAEKSFREIFYEIFIPLMEEIGLLWQTNTITPAHEHFISYLIKQQIMLSIQEVQLPERTKPEKVFVLSLPENEIHDLGLLYLYYEIGLSGYKVIYLGESMPVESLTDLKKHLNSIVYLSYFTVQPPRDEIVDYVSKMDELLIDNNTAVWLIGRMTAELITNNYTGKALIFQSIPELISCL